MRTIIDIPDEQRDALDAICARDGISRAEAIRRAIAQYMEAEDPRRTDEAWEAAFGIWTHDPRDASEIVDELRGEPEGDTGPLSESR